MIILCSLWHHGEETQVLVDFMVLINCLFVKWNHKLLNSSSLFTYTSVTGTLTMARLQMQMVWQIFEDIHVKFSDPWWLWIFRIKATTLIERRSLVMLVNCVLLSYPTCFVVAWLIVTNVILFMCVSTWQQALLLMY